MAPVLAGCASLLELERGDVTLWHLALANDAIAVQAENRRRAQQK